MTSGYFIANGESPAETERLLQLHRCLARYLGDVAADLLGSSAGQQVLDIGCGGGDWALDLAQRFPSLQIVGIDISMTRISHARKLAVERGLEGTCFLLMDASKTLDFPEASFDLIHVRFAQSYLSAAAWPSFLTECRRVLRPGGRLVVVECENPITTSEACERLCASYAQACRNAGTACTPFGSALGVTAVLASWLHHAGYEPIEDGVQAIDFSAGMPAHEDLVCYFQMLLPLTLPFLVQHGALSQGEATDLVAAALAQMDEPTFCGIWYYRTIIGSQP
jgi:SAM-dependent methyltransferase